MKTLNKTFLLLLSIAFFSIGSYAQTIGGDNDESILTYAEQMPSFPGGSEALNKFITTNMKYPPLAKENGIEGRSMLSFTVGSDGKISNIQDIKKLGWGCDEEAIRLVKLMPAWIPGKQNGKAVAVRYTLPVKFAMQQ